MDEIRKFRVYLLGDGDLPLHAPIDVIDPEALQVLRALVTAEEAIPHPIRPHTGVVRAVVRTGAATLQRLLKAKPHTITNDGKLDPLVTTPPEPDTRRPWERQE